MTQRIFDIENEKDYSDLWDILPDEAIKARKVKAGIEFLDKDNKPCLYIHDGDGGASIIKINWHDKTEITRPVNYEDMIGCVGWFHDTEEVDKKHDRFSILCSIKNGDEHLFRDEYRGSLWKHFTPAKKSELKFWGD